MLLIRCPYCEEERPELEFRHAGEAHVVRPENISQIPDEDFEKFFFIRSNPKGIIYERWRHVHGCGRFFNAVRDTVSDRFFLTYKAGEKRPDPSRFARKVEAVQEAATVEAGAGVVEPTRQEAAAPSSARSATPKPAAPRAEAPKPAAPARKAAPTASKTAKPKTETPRKEAKTKAAAPAEAPKPAKAAPRKPTRKGDA